jgi:hypothetical protein
MASARRSRRVPDHGLGSYNRDYEYVRQQLLDLDDADQLVTDALQRLREAVASGSASQAFRAKQSAQLSLGETDRVIEAARISDQLGKLDRLPRNTYFDKAHDLMRAFRTQLGRVRDQRRALSRVAFGSLDDMRARLAETARDVRRRLSPEKQRRIADKIRTLRYEGYPQRQAIAIAYRMEGVSRRGRDRGR